MTATALITGASYGIGYEPARLFARDGIHLAIVARNKDKLDNVKAEIAKDFNVSVWAYPVDLAKEGATDKLYQDIHGEGRSIEHLINNAGIGLLGPFTETARDKEKTMINLNMTALTHLSKLFLPQMIAKGSGKIMNVASTAAFQPGTEIAIYYVTETGDGIGQASASIKG